MSSAPRLFLSMFPNVSAVFWYFFWVLTDLVNTTLDTTALTNAWWMWRHRQTAVERLAGQKDLPFAPCPFPRAAARFFVTTDTAAGKPHLFWKIYALRPLAVDAVVRSFGPRWTLICYSAPRSTYLEETKFVLLGLVTQTRHDEHWWAFGGFLKWWYPGIIQN